MGKWFQHCWEGTAAVFCCWSMTDFLFPFLSLNPYHLLSPLYFCLYIFFHFFFSCSWFPLSHRRYFYLILFKALSPPYTHANAQRRILTITHKGPKLWKYIPRNISPRNFNRALSHFSFVKYIYMNICVCVSVFTVWNVQMSPQVQISKDYAAKVVISEVEKNQLLY